MLVNCRDINEKRPKEECYKAPDGKYYSSEQGYLDVQFSKKKWNECLDVLSKIFGYYDGMKFPTTIPKRLKQLNTYGYDVVLETIYRNAKPITWAIKRKDFNTEYQRIAYVFGIIEHDILSVYQKKQNAIEASKNMESKEIDNIDLNQIGSNKKSRDVSKLLGDLIE